MKKLVMIVAVLAAAAWAGTASAAIGISLEHNGSYTPAVGLNFQPSGWTIDLLGHFRSLDDKYDDVFTDGIAGTTFGVGVRLDKLMDETADVSGLWGLCGDLLIDSPSADGFDSMTNFAFGAYLGGNAHVGSENFHLVGHCGVKVEMDDLGEETATNFGTFANLMLRWTGALSK